MIVRAKTDVPVNFWLTPGKEYDVIEIAFYDFRVVGDGGEPTLFAKEEFDVVDPAVPAEWVRRDYGEDEVYYSPPELSEQYFWEDYFDKKEAALRAFETYVVRHGIRMPLVPKKLTFEADPRDGSTR